MKTFKLMRDLADALEKNLQSVESGIEAAMVSGANAVVAEVSSQRAGELRESISFEVADKSFVVGSDSEAAVAQELGTPTIRPHAFLAPALHRSVPRILQDIGESVEKSLAGEI